MADLKRITFIIVTYNSSSYIDKCLASIDKHFDKYAKDIVVVDNKSTDGTQKLLITKYPGVRNILANNNLGYGAAANMAIKEVKTKYCLVLNADIEFIDDSIYKLCDYMDKNPRIGLMGCSYLNTDGTVQYRGALIPDRSMLFYVADQIAGRFMPRNSKYLTDENIIMSVRRIAMVQGACMMIRREAFEEIGYFDERLFLFGEEKDISTRLRKKHWEVFIDPSVKVIHHGSVSVSQESERSIIEKHKAEYYIMRKHHGWLNAILYRLLVIGKYSLKGNRTQTDNILLSWALKGNNEP